MSGQTSHAIGEIVSRDFSWQTPKAGLDEGSDDGAEIGGADLGVSIPLAWSPDGAFLTVGFGRPFPERADYDPPATAPASVLDIEITVGPAPPFDLDAEPARFLRHQ